MNFRLFNFAGIVLCSIAIIYISICFTHFFPLPNTLENPEINLIHWPKWMFVVKNEKKNGVEFFFHLKQKFFCVIEFFLLLPRDDFRSKGKIASYVWEEKKES